MTARKYSKAVERAGGIESVARQLNCGRDRILRRVNGTCKVTSEALLAVESLPETEHWQVVSRLKCDRRYRKTFTKRTSGLPDGDPAKALAERLLAQTFNGYRAFAGGRKKWRNVKETA